MSLSSKTHLQSRGAPATLPIFVHGKFMLPEVLMLYLAKKTLATISCPGRLVTEPLVVCPATLHGYHRRKYSLESGSTPKRKESLKKGGTFGELVRRKSLRLARNQRSKTQLSIPLSAETWSGSVDTTDYASCYSEVDDEQIASLLSPHILPGPTFDSKVEGVLFWPRSQQEFDAFIQDCHAAAVDEDDGETKGGAHVLDVEVFLDDAHEQHGSYMAQMIFGKESHHCWELIKEFDLHQREDPNRSLNEVPEVRAYVQSSPGFRDHVVIQKTAHGERLVHPDEDTPGSAPDSPPFADSCHMWQSGGLPTLQNGLHTRESTMVKAVAFISGTTPPSSLERDYELLSAQGMRYLNDGDIQVQVEDSEELTVERKKRVWSYRTSLLQAGKKWKLADFRDLVVPGLIRGVEEAYRKRAVERQESQRGFIRRFWRWAWLKA